MTVHPSQWSRIEAIRATLAALYPGLFDLDNPIPLRVGIHFQIRQTFPDLPEPGVTRLLSWLTSRVPYLLVCHVGKARYGLEGQDGTVEEGAAELAAERLQRLGVANAP